MLSRNLFRKSAGCYQVVTETSYPDQIMNSETTYTKTDEMDTCYSPSSANLPQETSKIVDFDLKDQIKENKKKYFTAKYGAHQMLLIKKRLDVEMWVFDELKKLYNSENDDHDCEMDLDELLDLDTESERKEYILTQLQDAKQPPDVVSKFVDELLKRAKTL